MEPERVVNSISFSQDFSSFTLATSQGFQLYKVNPLKMLIQSCFDHPLKLCETLGNTFFSLVGLNTVDDPNFNPRTVTFWDNHSRQQIGRQTFQSEVNGVKMRKDKVVVAADNSIFVYSLMDLNFLRTLITGPNPNGLIAISFDTPEVLACPHTDPGSFYILKGDNEKVCKAHKRELSEMALNKAGTILATTSTKGTLIRLFSTNDLTKLFEFRRGTSSAAITSLAFHPTEQLFACSSVRGTVHIYSLIEGHNQSSMFSFARSILPSYFSSEWSNLTFTVPEGPNKVAFTKDGIVIVLKADGSANFRNLN